MVVRGTVLHCSRFGAVVRLDDGRLANYPSAEAGIHEIRRASAGGRRPSFAFVVEGRSDGRIRLSLANAAQSAIDVDEAPAQNATSTSFEEKIIDFLRQTSEWDTRASSAPSARGDERPRADRLLPFELRARRQYRDTPERPKRRKR